MGGRIRRMGIGAAALAVLLVGGLATAALADGGPNRMPGTQSTSAPHQNQTYPLVSGQRAGFGDRIVPARPGFGDRIRPGDLVLPGIVTANASGTTATRPAGSASGDGPMVALILGLGLGGLATVGLATAYRRRVRLAHTA